MPILFSSPKPEDFPQNYHVVNDVLRTGRMFRTNRGCEVGVRHGFFSRFLMERNQWLSMWCVDPYLPYVDIHEEFTQEKQDEIRTEAARLLSCFGPRVSWLYTDSVSAAARAPRGFFDFVFIDANHEYKFARQDISHWHACVRKGGLLCGHDYTMDGVKQAVHEFADEYKYDLKVVKGTADVWLMEVNL